MPSVSSKRSRDSVHLLPNHACSIGATPRPTPKSRRPPVSWSATHMSSMIWTGWCSGSSFTIGPSRIVLVTCDAAAMKTSWLGAMHRPEPWCSARWKLANPASSASFTRASRSWNSRCVGVPGMSSMWSKMPKVGITRQPYGVAARASARVELCSRRVARAEVVSEACGASVAADRPRDNRGERARSGVRACRCDSR